MHLKENDDMKGYGLYAIAIVLLLATFMTTQTTGTLTVTGVGEVTAVPDTATISFSAQELESTAEVAQLKISMKTRTFIDKLKEIGISEEEIKTTSYSLRKEQRYDDESKEYVELGYRARTSYRVEIKDIDLTAKVIDLATQAGLEIDGSVYFSVDDPTSLEEEAKALAISDAKAKAEKMAVEAGVSLKKIISISSSGSGYYPISRYLEGESIVLSAQIEPGTQDITQSVTIVYEI